MRRATRLLVALPFVLAAIGVAVVFRSAQHNLSDSARVAATQNQLAFSIRLLRPASSFAPFEPVASAAAFTSAAVLDGRLYLAGQGGLIIFSADGTLLQSLRTGLELPVAPIVSMTVGRPRGATEPELLIATQGAGLLLLEPGRDGGAPALRQLLPARHELAYLTSLLALPSGDLLLGTRRHGVLLYSGATLSQVMFESGGVDSAALEITALAAANSGSYLIGTRNSGLIYLHAGTARRSDATSGMPDQQVESILVRDENAFVGTPLGVAEFDLSEAGEGALHTTRILVPGTFSHALTLDAGSPQRGARLLVGTLDQGVVPAGFDSRAHLTHAAIHPESGDSLGEPAERVDQFLSVSGEGAPLYALADGRLLARTAAGWSAALPNSEAAGPALTDRNISALAFDGEGRLFIGFFDRGLDILSSNRTEPVRHLEDDHLFCVNRLILDPTRNTIAAATANGLVLFDRQGSPRQVLTRRDGLISSHVTDIAFTRSGAVLATPAGLSFIRPADIESLYAFQGLVNNHVYALAAQPATDNLLAGTLGGLSVLNSDTVARNFTATNSGLKHNWITAIAAMPDGSDLIGTYGAGVERMIAQKDGSRLFLPTELPAGAPRDLIINPNALLVTSTHVYAGTLAHGMLVYTMSSNRWSVVTEGLPSLNVTAFAARGGTLYVGTDNGLVRIEEQTLGRALP